MHEMSIVEALLSSVRRELTPYPGAGLQLVRVQAGQLRQVVPEILETCFQAATRDTELAGARLEIEVVAAVAKCGLCSLEFPVEEDFFECPRCQSVETHLLHGDELDLMSLKIEPCQNSPPA